MTKPKVSTAIEVDVYRVVERAVADGTLRALNEFFGDLKPGSVLTADIATPSIVGAVMEELSEVLHFPDPPSSPTLGLN